jgi:hypothetical protein
LTLREIRLETRLVQVLLAGLENQLLIILDTGRRLVYDLQVAQYAGTRYSRPV